MAQNGDILKRFGLRVRELRKERGLSQEGFAAECGLSRTYMGGISTANATWPCGISNASQRH